MDSGTTGNCRIGVDVGGTFTDIVFMTGKGKIFIKKILSTPDDYSRAINDGIKICFKDSEITADEVVELIHGCTVATNAILEQKGALIGLITTKGFRDILEIRRFRMPELYNVAWNKPAPLVRRQYRLEVSERVDTTGKVITPLDTDEAEKVIERLVSMGVEGIAVSLINCHVNPIHEKQIKEILSKKYPSLFFSLSSEIIPVMREYERTSEAVVNTYIKPVVVQYMQNLAEALKSLSIHAPVYIMESSGGMMSLEASCEKPVYIVECGPAAGVVGAAFLSKRIGIPNIICLDMGGTTTKASCVEGGRTSTASQYEVGAGITVASHLQGGGGYVVRVPAIDIAEIGAGGGSIYWFDIGGALHSGPKSAGAMPGPVCYDQGGRDATVSDVNLILGYLPRQLAGGTYRLDHEKAHGAISGQIAKPLNKSLEEAAFDAYMITNSDMMRAIRAVTSSRGRDPRDFALFAYGGAGPMHAAALAKELDIQKIVVAPNPGLFSAFGLLFADVEHHYFRSFMRVFDDTSVEALNEIWGGMEKEAMEEIGKRGYQQHPEMERAVDARYVGQSTELIIPVPWKPFRPENVIMLRDAFDEAHLREYAHQRKDIEVEIVNLRLTTKVPSSAKDLKEAKPDRSYDAPLEEVVRKAYFGREYGWLDTRVMRIADLGSETVDGPAIIELYDSTSVVPPYARTRKGPWDTILIDIIK
jgi:N-methylhydantoinase A